MRRLALILVLAFAGALLVAPAADAATPGKFSNCTKLQKRYPHGVAKSRPAAAKQYRLGNYKPTVKPAVYALNKRNLDRDKDGTACEVTRPKTKPTPTAPTAPKPMMIDAPLDIDAIVYDKYQGTTVTYLKARACLFSTEVRTTCSSQLTDAAGTVIPTSSNPGDGLASALALTPGAAYTLVVSTSQPAHWSCSMYNPDGCSWITATQYTYRWTFTYQNVENQIIPQAEVTY
ncbi:hypothetical protein GCM10023350_53020 [Nocardioides endophyticus]|uniref:Excalibur calcium-binding domain-containing protein n=1 Tax=Nocardioides endophyticus TaxID=1353775 RepID=A0ABP8ZM48_9ACTN